MKSVKPTKAWSISLLIGSLCSLIIVISGIVGLELPDIVKVILGVMILIALPVAAYTTVKMLLELKANKE